MVVEQCFRVCVFIILPLLYINTSNNDKSYDNFDAESQSLLRKKLDPHGSEESAANNGYGSTTAAPKDADADSYLERERKAKEAMEKRLKQDGNWFTYAKGFSMFFPLFWPYHNKLLQVRAILVGCTLLTENALDLLVPIQFGVVVDSLMQFKDGNGSINIWIPLVVYAALRVVNGSVINSFRRWLWLPVEQYGYDAISTASHAHIMSLSSDFHDNKTTAELTQAIRGGRSVADLLESIMFRFIPMFIDLAIAYVFLVSLFGPYMGLILVATTVAYLYTTTKLTALRAERRRAYINASRKEQVVNQQSIEGWNTASLFNMVPYETDRYAGAVKETLRQTTLWQLASYISYFLTSNVLVLGRLGAMTLAAYQVAYGTKTIGDFTTLFLYWGQLQSPLSYYESLFRQISQNLMEAERLLELFQTKPTVVDRPGATQLRMAKGTVVFDDVSFAYDERKPTLKNVSFQVPAGKTIALVGETGGGKSTILKLVDRFYDVNGGSISIDGQNIQDVTISSLRERIGVVPQEPTLFNDTIMNNIRYARMSATDEEVFEACKAASVHDKIMTFPDGKSSPVN